MIHLGLIGYPLGHSLSPKIHEAALKACGLEGDYVLFPIEPANGQGLKGVLARLRKGEVAGLNVTIPHKINVIPLLDELTPAAQAIGAVNTIYLREKRLIGHNTDAQGFLSDLKKFLAESPSPKTGEGMGVREKNALVLGAGGSARAVVYALLNDGWQVTVASRRIEQGRELVAQFKNVNAVVLNLQTFQLSDPHLIVNTTPIGMAPNTDQTPLPENLSFPDALIYDLVYNPRETKLVKDARSQGLSAVTGIGMLVEQAALSFELWTGCCPSRESMFEAANRAVH